MKSNLEVYLRLRTELRKKVLSDIEMMDMYSEWSDFYPVVKGTDEYYRCILQCEHTDSCTISDEDYQKIIVLFDELSYLLDDQYMISLLDCVSSDGFAAKTKNSRKKIRELSFCMAQAFQGMYDFTN